MSTLLSPSNLRHASQAGLLSVLIALAVAVCWVSPASAHGSGSDPTNYRSAVIAVAPEVGGLHFDIVQLGDFLRIENRTNEELLVLGYEGEPYLRVTPTAVLENTRSPASYLNAASTGVGRPPPEATADAAPAWREISNEPVAFVHDHRIHEMSAIDLAKLPGAAGDQTQNPRDWSIAMTYAGAAMSVQGELVYEAAPSPAPWIVVTAAVLLVTIMLPPLRTRRALTVLLGVLVGTDVLHVAGIVSFGVEPLSEKVVRAVTYNLYVVAAWPIGIAAAVLVWRNRRFGYTLAMFFATFTAYIGGVSDLSWFTSSQLPFAFPDWLGRASVALSLALGVGLLVQALRAQRGTIRLPALAPRPDANLTSQTRKS